MAFICEEEGYNALANDTTLVKLKHVIYLSVYWWISSTQFF